MIKTPAITPDTLILSHTREVTNPPLDIEIIRGIIDGCTADTIPSGQALRLLDAIGISRERELFVSNPTDVHVASIEIGMPVSISTVPASEDEMPETVSEIYDENTLRVEFNRMVRSSETQGVMVRPSLIGAKMYFGIRRRARYGHVIVCSICSDGESRPSRYIFCSRPVSQEEAREAYTRAGGSGVVGQIIFIDTLRRLSALCEVAPEIFKMDIWPVVGCKQSIIATGCNILLKRESDATEV